MCNFTNNFPDVGKSTLVYFVVMQAVIVTECAMNEVFQRHLFFSNTLAIFFNYELQHAGQSSC